MTVEIIIAVALLAIGALLGHVQGWSAGVRETEQRWSDAVQRADHDRQTAALASPGREALEQLVVEWRDPSRATCMDGDGAQPCAGTLACAAQLEAALRLARSGER